ncbi:MAG: beta-CASP ribonuclease aCPSF1 [Candidatus Anstonellales archaeon]
MSDLEITIKKLVPNATKIEYWGSSVAIYVPDLKEFYEDKTKIRSIATEIKKKVLIRANPENRKNEEKTRALIEELVKEAGITNIYFNHYLGEVHIEALKPGIVIGKNGEHLKIIASETGWVPVVLRTPTMPSTIIDGNRKSDIAYAEEKKKFLIKVAKSLERKSSEHSWIRFVTLGAFREIGRSCLLIQTKNSKILIDAGIHTGLNPLNASSEDLYPYVNMLGFPINDLDAVILTHAHADHVAFLPFLFAAGYDGPVYATQPTKDLTALIQNDYLNVLTKGYGANTPYTKKDIQKELRNFITVNYEEIVDITSEIKLSFYNAGHILGSAIVHLNIGEGKHNILHTGDLKFGFGRLLNPAHTSFPRADTLFIESTYGGKNDVMPQRAESEAKLMSIINETLLNKGKVLIPVFAVGRAQEVLLAIEAHVKQNKDWNYPIYIDGMILEASAIHTAYPEYLKENIEKRILSNDSPFEIEHLKIAVGMDKQSIAEGEPAVILAPSGMLTGGPSVEYLKLLADDTKSTLIFVGYQSALSLGSKIQQGIREFQLPDEDGSKHYTLKMRVETAEGFSGHSDRRQLMAWIKNINQKLRAVYTMHGDYNKTDEFAKDIAKTFRVHAEAPFNMEARRLK